MKDGRAMTDDEVRASEAAMLKMAPQIPSREYVIPAQPGWYVLHGVVDEGGDAMTDPFVGFSKSPIVAWWVNTTRSPRTGEPLVPPPEPITAEGSESGAGLLRPDGSVVRVGLDTYTDEKAFLQMLNAGRQKTVR